MNLSDFKAGDTLTITSICDERLKNRLLNFGCYVDSSVVIKQSTPLGDPMIIAIRDTEIAIRKIDAQKVECELCQ